MEITLPSSINYKGCIIYKELQKIKYPTAPPKKLYKQPEELKTNPRNPVNQERSYAEAVQNNCQRNSTQGYEVLQQVVPDITNLKETMQCLMSQILTVTKILTELMSKLPLLIH
jgi:hypothetical protein